MSGPGAENLNRPVITVVTPVFNSAKYLGGCLESVSKQTFQHAEHIVIDGGSTDGTVEILEQSSVRWLSEPDEGMYDAVNKGLALATGDIVGYINADDRLFPDSLSLINDAFQSDPQTDFVYGYCTYVDEQERTLATFHPSPLTHRYGHRTRITFAQPTCFWRNRLLPEIGLFNPDLKTAGDADFFYRLLRGPYEGRLIKRPLAKFMVRSDALSLVMEREMGDEIASIRKANGIRKLSLPYIANEFAFYMANFTAYVAYAWNRRLKPGHI